MCFSLFKQSDIREQLKDTVKFQVDRSTHGDKLRDYHEWMTAIKKDTLHHVRDLYMAIVEYCHQISLCVRSYRKTILSKYS